MMATLSKSAERYLSNRSPETTQTYTAQYVPGQTAVHKGLVVWTGQKPQTQQSKKGGDP